MDPNIKEQLDQAVKSRRIVLFMKGTPAFPQCGFSNQAVQILRFHGAEFGSVNVLDDMAIREGVKEYSNWPTIPQLYVDGEFIGGADIMMEMHNAGELPALLGGESESAE